MKFIVIESMNNNAEVTAYHGSNDDISHFNQKINWFSTDKEYATEFALATTNKFLYTVKIKLGNIFDCGVTDGRVFRAFPATEPYKFSSEFLSLISRIDMNETDARNLIEKLAKNNSEKYTMKIFSVTNSSEFADILLSIGYDTIKSVEFGHECYGILNADKINIVKKENLKSADEMDEKLSPDGYEPKKKGIAYKVFKVKNGKLYPPMVANAGGADTPVGVWLDAEEGEFAGLSKTGRPQVKSTGSGNLSYRPGWHLGDIPRAKQFDRTNKETGEEEFPKDFVWAECEYAMDVDYQPESDARGYERTKVDADGNVVTYKSDKYQHSLAGVPHLPSNGYYKYRTNPNPDTVPWVITGQMKVNRLLDDFEVNEILKKNGIAPIHRQGGDKTLKELGLKNIGESIEKLIPDNLKISVSFRPIHSNANAVVIDVFANEIKEKSNGAIPKNATEIENIAKDIARQKYKESEKYEHPYRISIMSDEVVPYIVNSILNTETIEESMELNEDIDSMKKFYPNIPEEEFMKYIELDPTYKGGNNAGSYARWILGLANKNAIDNIGHIRDILTRFEENKKNLKDKDIMKFKSIDELEKYLNDDNSYQELSHRQEVRQRQNDRRNVDLGKDAELVFENADWEVWVPKTYAASCKLGQGTTWCTASTETDYYYNYYKENNGGEYYININKHNPEEKYQFHFETSQFMDKDDRSIEISDFFDENPELKDFYTEIVIHSYMKEYGLDEEDDYGGITTDKRNIGAAIDDIRRRDMLDGKFVNDMIIGDGTDWDYFSFDYDAIDMQSVQYSLDDINEENEEKIKNLGVDINTTSAHDIYDEHEDIYDAIFFACLTGREYGAHKECIYDISREIKNSVPDFVADIEGIGNGEKEITFSIDIQKLKNSIWKIIDTEEHPDDIAGVICNHIASKGSFYEPRYGWDGFDKEAFNEDLSYRLSEIGE